MLNSLEQSGKTTVRRSTQTGNPEKQTTKQLLLGFLTELSLIALAVWAALSFVVCVNIHYGNNMYPSMRDGDLVVRLRIMAADSK